MSKILILSAGKENQKDIEEELLKLKVKFILPISIPTEYNDMYCIQLLNIPLSYHCRNIYEIINGNIEKKDFDNFISALKTILIFTSKKIHLCLQWDGDNTEEINDIYEQKVINLFSFEFPEDEFEFEFNVDYVFVYEE